MTQQHIQKRNEAILMVKKAKWTEIYSLKNMIQQPVQILISFSSITLIVGRYLNSNPKANLKPKYQPVP